MTRPELQSIGIEEVDRAVRDWFDRTVDAHVESQNGERKKVPVIFSSGERFATSRTRKAVRDKNGVLVLPLISIRRTGVSPNPDMQALGVETDVLRYARRVDPKTNDLQNLDKLRTAGQKLLDPVVFDVYTIPFPDRSVMTYELLVQAGFTLHANAILEKIFFSLNNLKSFVAPLDNGGYVPPKGDPLDDRQGLGRGYVVGFIDSDLSSGDNFEEFTDQERVVRWTTPIRVPATLQLDPEGTKPAVGVRRTSYTMDFLDEGSTFVDDPRLLEQIFGKLR